MINVLRSGLFIKTISRKIFKLVHIIPFTEIFFTIETGYDFTFISSF